MTGDDYVDAGLGCAVFIVAVCFLSALIAITVGLWRVVLSW